jgi:hypothetical protein
MCELLHAIIVDNTGLLVQSVWECLEVLGDCGDLLRGSLVAVRQVTAMGQVETEDAVMGVENSGIGIEVGRRAGKCYSSNVSWSHHVRFQGGDVLTLYVNTPLVRTQAERLERSFLT